MHPVMKLCASAFLVGISTPPMEARAQNANAPTVASITLVAKANLPRAAKVVVERRARLNPRDVIFVDLERATAPDLAAAVQTFSALHHRSGDDPDASVRAAPKSYTPPPGFDNSHFGRQMKAALVRLVAAPEMTVAGIGRAQAVTITVAVSRGQERQAGP